MIPSCVLAIGGNYHVIFLTAMSYLGDILSKNNINSKGRTFRFVVAEACAVGGAPIGLFLGKLNLDVGCEKCFNLYIYI